ncbi:MAG: hypothetical protein JO293_07220 [Candidatus Eremiobacteraeota bacterium]|nr:hypothetical protein [Candidatus Eremiobacteraeota bacterium]MBV8281989.1 hypothetical protein [Candidatus Eremiobacteraeota bacterium]
MKPTYVFAALAALVAATAGAWLFAPNAGAATASLAAATPEPALTLAERGLTGPAGPDDEGQYRLIDPVGPGGATSAAAQTEVFSPTMIGGQYTHWRPYHDPFAGGGYGGNNAPQIGP